VNIDAAKKEGRLVIYGTIVPQVMKLIPEIVANLYLMEDPSAEQLKKLQGEFRQIFLK
jgi:hypothetical protein